MECSTRCTCFLSLAPVDEHVFEETKSDPSSDYKNCVRTSVTKFLFLETYRLEGFVQKTDQNYCNKSPGLLYSLRMSSTNSAVFFEFDLLYLGKQLDYLLRASIKVLRKG